MGESSGFSTLRALLERELQRLKLEFPGCLFRASLIRGKRVSYLAGDSGEPFGPTLTRDLPGRVRIHVGGGWGGREAVLERALDALGPRIAAAGENTLAEDAP